MKRLLLLFMSFTFLFLPVFGWTQEDEAGWSGSVILGAGWQTGRASQLEYDDDYEEIETLDEKRDRESQFLPAVLFDVSYTFEEIGTSLFVLHQIDDSGAGTAQSLGDYGEVFLSIDYVREKVWENPYLLNEKREDTRVDLPSFSVGWDEILGSGAMLEYSCLRVDVDDDEIGEEEPDLERDGKIHTVEAGYAIPINESNVLIPHVGYTKANIDGESNEYKGYSAGLSYEFTQKERFSIELSFSGGKDEYEKIHPIFNETREDKIYSCGAVVTFLNPFGFEDFFVSVLAQYDRVDSNINFFDSHSTIIGAGVGYQF